MAYAYQQQARFGAPPAAVVAKNVVLYMVYGKNDKTVVPRKDERMSDISTLESRITAALDRIRQGLDAPVAQEAAADPALQAALVQERAQNAELVERVRLLKERQDTQVASLTLRAETQSKHLMKLDEELQQLRASNVQLREMNARLRETVTTGLAPELHDAAIEAELEALRAQRSADAAEVDAILDELKPLIEETSHAAG